MQVAVLTITDKHGEYAVKINHLLRRLGLRTVSDLRNEKIAYKIRQHIMQRVSYMLTVGDREQQQGTVSGRCQNGDDWGSMSPDDFYRRIQSDMEVSQDNMGEISSAP